MRSLLRALVSMAMGLAGLACSSQFDPRNRDPRDVYLGPPGTKPTYVLVTVQKGSVTADVYRLRSIVEVGGDTKQATLPKDKPSKPIEFPTDYAIIAADHTGTLKVTLEALDDGGAMVGRAVGSTELVEGGEARLDLTLGKPCAQDTDCEDGVFCNGDDKCVDTVCLAQGDPCGSGVECAVVTCLEQERACSAALDDSKCPPPVTRPDGTVDEFYCDQLRGCLPGKSDAPDLVGTPELTPTKGTLGTVFHLRFEMSERLSEDPDVRVDVGGRRAGAVLLESGTDRPHLRYEYTYTADGSEQPGRRDITVRAVDQTDTEATRLYPKQIELDFLKPSVVGVPILGSGVLRLNTETTLDVTFSEDLAGPPTLRMTPVGTPAAEDAPQWEYVGTIGAQQHRFHYLASGAQPEGAYDLMVEGVDLAGNSSGVVMAARVSLDFTAPTVLANPPVRVIPPMAAVGRTVAVEIHVSEKPPVTPHLSAVNTEREIPFQASESSDVVLTFLHTVNTGEDGIYDLILSDLADAAGNVRDPFKIGTVTFDGTPPALTYFALDDTALNAQDTLVARFEANEPLGAVPMVRLAGLPLVRSGNTTRPYVYKLAMEESGLVGTYTITVEMADLVTNKSITEAGQVDVDAIPPRFVDAVFTPPVARLGITAYLSITVSESLAAPPELTWDSVNGDPGFSFAARSGLTYTYGLTVSGNLHPGIYRLQELTFTDTGGNRVVAKTSEDLGLILDFTVDNVPPALTNVQTDRSIYSAKAQGSPPYNVVTLTFDSSESVDLDPASLEVTVAGRRMNCGSFQPLPPSYTCRYTVQGEGVENEGVALVTVLAKDTAGNVGVANAAVTLDFHPPELVTSEVRPAMVRLGDTATYAFSVNESLGDTPSVMVEGASPLVMQYVTDSHYTFRHTASAQDVNGDYTILVVLKDPVGNASLPLPGGSFHVDVTPPLVTNLATNAPRYSAMTVPQDFSLVVLTMDLSENVDGPLAELSASVGLEPMACDAYQATSPNYTCRYVVTSDMPEGVHPVLVSATDAAGNLGFNSTTVVLDFHGPAVVQSSVALQLQPPAQNPLETVTRVAEGTAVLLDLTVTEALLAGADPDVHTTVPAPLHFFHTGAVGLQHRFLYTLDNHDVPSASYTVVAALVDSVGNPATVQLILPSPGLLIDTVAPQVVPDQGPNAAIPAYSTSFAFHSTEEDLFLCRADNGARFDCSSPERQNNLAEGAHQFTVWAVDGAGNISQPHTWDFRVDTAPPEVTFTAQPASATPDTTADFDFVCSEAHCTFQCRLDDGDFLACTAPHHLDAVAPGTHTLMVRATDEAGNQGPAASATWRRQGKWLAIAAGRLHSCGIAEGNTLWCWGDNSRGQVGDSTSEARSSPVRVGTDANWVSLTSAEDHTCALKQDRSLWCWGYNWYGQVGDGTWSNKLIPKQVGIDQTWTQISAGGNHTCGVKADHSLWCWGYNGDGQLGYAGSYGAEEYRPVRVGLETTWSSVGGGYAHTCAIKTDGSLWCWGNNTYGQLGDNTTTRTNAPLHIGTGTNWQNVNPDVFGTCARTTAGALWCWGYNTEGEVGDGTNTERHVPTKVGDQTGWKLVETGGYHSCAVDALGQLQCWGMGTDGRLGDGSISSHWSPTAVNAATDWVAAAAGRYHTCGLRADGSLWCWGTNTNGQLGFGGKATKTVPAATGEETDWSSLSAGFYDTCATHQDGRLQCWGDNSNGQIGDGTLVHRATPVDVNGGNTWAATSTGYGFVCGIRSPDGSLWCWGTTDAGRTGTGSPPPATYLTSPTAATLGVGNFTAITSGRYHSCAVTGGGDLYCWGHNADAQLGTGNYATAYTPTRISPVGAWRSAAAGGYHSCAVRSDNSLWCWGSNLNGQLGVNNNASQVLPVQVAAGEAWQSVGSGDQFSCAIKADQSLWCWGDNSEYQMGDGTLVDSLVPKEAGLGMAWLSMSLGGGHTCAIAADHTLWCWGRNGRGQCGDGHTENVTLATQVGRDADWGTVVAGIEHTCARKQDGTLWCWGSNQWGQAGDGSAFKYSPVEVPRQ